MKNEDFRGKYESSGAIGGWLIGKFYESVADLVRASGCGGGRVLELGVGAGYSTAYLAPMLEPGAELHASELRHDLAREALGRVPGARIACESVYRLARRDRSHDLVVCLEVLEHLEQPQHALAEIARVCRGRAIISVPREPIWRALNMARGKYLAALGNTPGHLQHWSTRALRAFVAPRFEILATRTPLPWTVLLLAPRP
jgi:2-polyprenyl-3-methyl-5-hydroxy-6-metoxy-1,4-benzoquinol methylase